MPHDKFDEEAQRIIQSLSDSNGLRERGIDEQWIQNCAALIEHYRRLERQFRQLEAELSSSETPSSDDTIVL